MRRAANRLLVTVWLTFHNRLGPNGAGKTTILSMLAGKLPISGGVALVGGYDCATEINQAQQKLGVVQQFDALWPHLTPRQHLIMFAELQGVVGRVAVNNAVSSVIEQLELDGDMMDLPAKFLSGGQRRRLSLGCAIVGNATILILDEITTGLDPETRQEIWAVVNKLRTPERCLLLTTHRCVMHDNLAGCCSVCWRACACGCGFGCGCVYGGSD